MWLLKSKKSDDLDWSGLKLNRPFKIFKGGLKLYDHLILKSSESYRIFNDFQEAQFSHSVITAEFSIWFINI